jgi:CubicO group peptidase (beta-lactamase class C family)
MRPLLSLLLGFSLLGATAIAQSTNSYSSIDTLLNRLDRHHKAMGSVLISRKGKVLYQRGFGEAEVGKHPNTPETVYRIGSITKTFTSVLVFQLIEKGKLSLTDPLSRWYPAVPNAEKITIDDLLTHHSGIHNITEDADFGTWQISPKTKAQVVARIAATKPDFAPGEKASYSNSNFILLGYIIEEATGKPYAENLRTGITKPLGLSHTSYGGPIHPERNEALKDLPSNMDVPGGAGGIVSTVGDMAKFLEALFLKHYLSESSLQKMQTLRDQYGRGLLRFPFYGDYSWGHGGHIDNFTTMLSFFPKDSTVFSIATNALGYQFNDILIGVMSLYYGKTFEMPDFSKKIEVDAAMLKKLEGVYTCKEIGMDITIKAEGYGITAQATGQGAFPLEAESESVFSNNEVGVHLSFNSKDETVRGFMLSQGGSRLPFVRKD